MEVEMRNVHLKLLITGDSFGVCVKTNKTWLGYPKKYGWRIDTGKLENGFLHERKSYPISLKDAYKISKKQLLAGHIFEIENGLL